MIVTTLESFVSGTIFPEAGVQAFGRVRALEEAASGAEHGAAQAAHAPGLPQLDFSFWPGHIVWTLIVFAVLYWVFEKHLLPKIEAPITARRGRIEADLVAAEKLKSEIDAARARADSAIAEARARGQKAAQMAQAEMATEAQTRRGLAEAQLAGRIAQTEAAIAKAEANALAQLETFVPVLAGEIVQKCSGLTLTREDIARSFAAMRKST